MVSRTQVAFLSKIHDTITTSGELAIVSATVRGSSGARSIAVSLSVIALLVNPNVGNGFSGHVFLSSVSATAFVKLGEIVDQGFQKLVGHEGTSGSLEENGQSQLFSGTRFLVEHLKFEVVSSSVE